MSTDTAPSGTPSGEPEDAVADRTVAEVAGRSADTPGTPEVTGTPPDEPEPDGVTDDARPPSARPLTAALLNLSGLGLGYLHLRAWLRLVVALAATGVLAWAALPIGREPISAWWAVGYVGALSLFALDAAHLARRRARRETARRTLWSPRAAHRVAWATLAVVPLLGVSYVVTQHEVLERHLAHDLDQAEESLQAASRQFAPFRDGYDAAYATYVRTAAEHPGTRAAERVPGLVDDLYAQAKGDDLCDSVPAVRHFAEPETAGPLRAVAQEELPGALHDCGLSATERGALGDARTVLDELLADHPASQPAQDLPGELTSWRDGLLKKLTGKGGCADTSKVVASTSFLAEVDSGTINALADKTRKQVPAGLLRCGVQQFEGEQYTGALQNLDALLDTYPRAKEADYAERVRIAAGIARVDPKIDVALPGRTEPEGTVTVTIYSYSPDPWEMVFTGPATGVLSVDPCEGCVRYAEDELPQCEGYSLTKPSASVTLPAGDYLTATRDRAGNVEGWRGGAPVEKQSFTTDFVSCGYTTEPE